MSEESVDRREPYAYPADLARLVHRHWAAPGGARAAEAAPSAATLEAFFAPCYQASLLREEERPVTFRAILAAPSLFARDGRPPESVQRLEFASPLPFDGAVVMTNEQDLVGFGGMITGRPPAVRRVARALDLEDEHVAQEDVGGVACVAQKHGRVTYWEQD